nr:heavy metal-associated isoprenylated plant protein 47-like [Quercus suber]
MKQKIVIKVQMTSDKCRIKAMKIAPKTRGVISVALEGSDKDQLAVIGEDVDSAKLTCLLEKKEKLDDEKPESLNLQLHQVIHHFTGSVKW